jgi:hypothetical protein
LLDDGDGRSVDALARGFVRQEEIVSSRDSDARADELTLVLIRFP